MRSSLIILLLPFLCFCESNDTDIRRELNSDVIIETREVFYPDKRVITFYCKTEEVYPCDNYEIITDDRRGESSFSFDFSGVSIGDICFTAIGPARQTISLEGVSKGDHAISFNTIANRNPGILRITDEEIKLVFTSEEGVAIHRPTTRRVPDNTYWGRIGYHSPGSEATIDSFFVALEEAGAVFRPQQPGHYYYYEIDNDGNVVADVENSGYRYLKPFVFQYEGDKSVIKHLVEVDAGKHHPDLYISMDNDNGDFFYNWR